MQIINISGISSKCIGINTELWARPKNKKDSIEIDSPAKNRLRKFLLLQSVNNNYYKSAEKATLTNNPPNSITKSIRRRYFTS